MFLRFLKSLNIVKNKYVRYAALAVLIVFSASFTLFFLKFSDWSGLIMFHWNAYEGIDFLGNKFELFGVIVSGFFMAAVNFILAEFFFERERFLSYIVSFATLMLAILVLIAISAIAYVN